MIPPFARPRTRCWPKRSVRAWSKRFTTAPWRGRGVGELIASYGEIDRPFYFRSSAKPFQAAVSQACGAGLVREQLALACASHDGQPVHVALVESILAGAGLNRRRSGKPARTGPCPGLPSDG